MKESLIKLNVKELSYKEMNLINGGGIGFYWLGQVIGYIQNTVEAVFDAYANSPEGHAVQQALLDFQ